MPKITQLPSKTIPQNSAKLVLVQDNETGHMTLQNLFSSDRYEIIYLKCLGADDALSTKTGVITFVIPDTLNNSKIVRVDIAVTTYSTSGKPTVNLYNVSTGNNILSTPVSIDANKYTSYDSPSTPAVVSGSNLILTGQRFRVDITGSGTGAKGLDVIVKVDKLWA